MKGIKWKWKSLPSEDLLVVDGVEIADLVGFGRNHTVAEGSRRWRGAV